jgi:Doubled CXXCH motif (Paired_CXXCH_1)
MGCPRGSPPTPGTHGTTTGREEVSIAEAAINRSVITTSEPHARPNRSLVSLVGPICCLSLALLCLFSLPLQTSGAQASAISESGDRGLETSPFWTDSQCGRCHQPQRTGSHPVDVVPSFAVPEAFVLTDGRMTCQTCHDVSTAQDHAEARRTLTVKLNGSGRRESFCQSCHSQADLTLTRAMHGSLGGRAHEQTQAGQTRWDRSGQAANRSSQCLSCHDGVLAAESRIRMGARSALQTGMTDHPINVSYSQATRDMIRKGADGQLVESTRLDPRLRLFEGEMSCETCHNLYSKNQHLLVFPNRRSQLCMSCHEV